MTTRVIPEKTLVTCDACGVVCAASNWAHAGQLRLRRHGLDHTNTPVGDASFSADVCDTCLGKVERALQAVFTGCCRP